jgi:hypothetical protein
VAQLILFVLAAVAVAIAVALWIWRSRVGNELLLMASTETSRTADVAAKPVGSVVELKGKLHGEAPLMSEFAKVSCLYYRALTEREVEHSSRNSKGQMERRRSYETITDVVRFAPVMVDDGSGRAVVNLEGAKVEGKQVHQRRETEGIDLASVVGSLIGASGRTIAHRFTEWVIEPDAPIYVLGTALGGGVVGKAPDGGKKQPFIVSVKSEEARTKSLRWTRIWLLVGAAVALVVAIALAYAAANSGGS